MEHSQPFNIRQVVIMSLFAGISFLLYFISFPILPFVSYMKVDFSDIPILLGMIMFGPLGGILIAAIKGLLYWVMTGVDIANFIGVAASFVASVSFMLPIYYVLKYARKYKTVTRLVLAVIAGTVSLSVIMALLNVSVLIPVYMAVLHMKITIPLSKLLLFGVIPFNLIKGVLVGAVFVVVADRMKAFLRQQSDLL
ncbi:membrane protein [Secundilactobacillus pentosiphilus]|uniref:Riboflavin transporter n=1 Tax=Secundilactobacillus pentosiphilus TaxID=1714682 RepID=A0A1Z5IMB4_9LACO|nr:ECF transporter S component [Secundilactobacillus pentosiphilus]GAX02900.1 membrane protein [Secundilactobacillus pentosiphilus]